MWPNKAAEDRLAAVEETDREPAQAQAIGPTSRCRRWKRFSSIQYPQVRRRGAFGGAGSELAETARRLRRVGEERAGGAITRSRSQKSRRCSGSPKNSGGVTRGGAGGTHRCAPRPKPSKRLAAERLASLEAEPRSERGASKPKANGARSCWADLRPCSRSAARNRCLGGGAAGGRADEEREPMRRRKLAEATMLEAPRSAWVRRSCSPPAPPIALQSWPRAPFDLLLLRVTRQVLHWFAPDDPAAFDPAHCPVFFRLHGPADGDYFLRFPDPAGQRRGEGRDRAIRGRNHRRGGRSHGRAAEAARMHATHIAGRLAGVTARVLRSEACLYTSTPDSFFVIDAHPAMPRVLVASACSGHGFSTRRRSVRPPPSR